MIDHCRRALLVAAAAYLALLPSNALSFWRSLAFGLSAVLTATLLVAMARDARHRVPLPGAAIPIAVAAWAAWAAASVMWSIDPAFTARELKSDVLWSLATMAIFYVAGTSLAGWRALAATALGSLAFWPALALGMHWSDPGWNPRLAHMGVVAYSTYLVTAAPLILLLAWPPPLGFRDRRGAVWVAVLLFALVLVTARLSENRIVWIALAAAIVLLAIALWPTSSAIKVALLGGGLLVVFGVLFADTVRERAEGNSQAHSAVAESLSADPRLRIWKHAAKHIAERPWGGYGYGRLILQDELREDTGNRLLTHAHNTFVSQWLQTGAVGVVLLVALFGALGLRYVGLVRSGDPTLARLGAVGLAVLASFMVKNLTDDFFFRANAKLFFAVHALLLGASTVALRERAAVSAAAVPVAAAAR